MRKPPYMISAAFLAAFAAQLAWAQSDVQKLELFWRSPLAMNDPLNDDDVSHAVPKYPDPSKGGAWIDASGESPIVVQGGRKTHLFLRNANQNLLVTFTLNCGGRVLVQTRVAPLKEPVTYLLGKAAYRASCLGSESCKNTGVLIAYDPDSACENQQQGGRWEDHICLNLPGTMGAEVSCTLSAVWLGGLKSSDGILTIR
jgi:hypothetical protein